MRAPRRRVLAGPCVGRSSTFPRRPAWGRAIRIAARCLTSACVVSLCACATFQSAFPRVQVTTPESRALLLDRVPFYPQTEYQCGPAALAGVLGASGIKASPQSLAPQVYLPDRRGSLQVELAAATRRAGRIPYPVERTPEALTAELALHRPVLVLQNLLVRTVPRWHYAVLVGADPSRNRFILNSGTERAMPVRASSFLRTWDWADRWGLVVLRPGELPAVANPEAYLTAVADFEEVAGNKAARPAYAAALKRWPHESSTHLALGNQAHAAGNRIKAAHHYRAGLARAPGDPVLGNNLASVLGELGCRAEAQAVLDATRPGDGRWNAQLAQTRREIEASRRRSATCDRMR